MEKKHTAVEWLELQIINLISYMGSDTSKQYMSFIEQAKNMEKQEMIEFAKGFWYYGNGSDAPPVYNEDVEKYYYKVFDK